MHRFSRGRSGGGFPDPESATTTTTRAVPHPIKWVRRRKMERNSKMDREKKGSRNVLWARRGCEVKELEDPQRKFGYAGSRGFQQRSTYLGRNFHGCHGGHVMTRRRVHDNHKGDLAPVESHHWPFVLSDGSSFACFGDQSCSGPESCYTIRQQ